MLARGDLDLADTTPDFVDSGLQTQLLHHEEYVCAVRDAHPIKSSRVSINRFLSFDHVLMSPSEGRFRAPADDALAMQGGKRRVALSVPSSLVLIEILQSGDLIALVPKRLLTGRSHSLRLIRPPMDVEGFDVIAAWHSRSQQDPAHEWFRDNLAKNAVKASQKKGRTETNRNFDSTPSSL